MNSRIWTVNLLCLGMLFALGWKLRRDWQQYSAKNGPQALEIHPLAGVAAPSPLPTTDYTTIARQNPFHPERNDIITEPTQTKVTGPPPLVYGSIILGSVRIALLGTEQSPKAERVAEGSTFAGYRLARVLPQSVVLDSGAGNEEIMFYNALERIHRQAGKTSASARPSTPPPAASSGNGQSASQAVVVNAEAANSSVVPPSSSTPAPSAPPGKEWRETPFGRMLFNKQKP